MMTDRQPRHGPMGSSPECTEVDPATLFFSELGNHNLSCPWYDCEPCTCGFSNAKVYFQTVLEERDKLRQLVKAVAVLKNVIKLADQVVCASTFAPQWRMYVTSAPEMEAWRKVLAEEKLYECE